MTTQPRMQYIRFPHQQQPGSQYVVMQQPTIPAQFQNYPIYQTTQKQQYLTQIQGALQQSSTPFMPYPTVAASQRSTIYPVSSVAAAMYYQPNPQGLQQTLQQPFPQPLQQPLQQPFQQPLQQPLQQPFHQPLQQPFQPFQQPLQQPFQHPLQQPFKYVLQGPAQHPQVRMQQQQTQHLHHKNVTQDSESESHRVAEQLLSLSDGNCSSDGYTNSDDEVTTSTTITTTQTTRSVIDTQPVSITTPPKRRGRGPGKKNKGRRMKRDTTNTPRRYCCTIPQCDKRFISPSKLRRHMLVHNGVKKYGCRVCHSRFGQKSALVVHLKRKHPDMLEQALNQIAPKTAAVAKTDEATTALTKSSAGSDTPDVDHVVKPTEVHRSSTVSEDFTQRPSPRHASGSQSPPPDCLKKTDIMNDSQNHA